jgi:hypothetical protein
MITPESTAGLALAVVVVLDLYLIVLVALGLADGALVRGFYVIHKRWHTTIASLRCKHAPSLYPFSACPETE